MASGVSVVAIIAAYNEADIIEQVVRDLIHQGIGVYLLDDGSTDGTAELIEPYVGRGVIRIERLCRQPDLTTGWERILRRKAELASTIDAQWFIHHDADEFRESPWPDLSLAEAIARVDRFGFNAIDFAAFNFWPTTPEELAPGADVRAAFEWCTAAASYDRVQIRAWKKTAPVDLATSGGHDAQFADRRVFPVRFIMRHYPIRGQAHGERKVFQERRERFPEHERTRGWHVQYDLFRPGDSFIRHPSTLIRFDPTAVRIDLILRHRGVEALEAQAAGFDARLGALGRSLAETRSALDDQTAKVQAARQELAELTDSLTASRQREAALQKSADDMRGELQRQSVTIRNLARTADERSRLLDDVYASRSWRWMAPARALFRMFGGS